MLGMSPPTAGPSTMNQQGAPFGHASTLGFGGQSPGLSQGVSGLSANPLEQQHQLQMLIAALRQGGMK